MLMSLPLPCSGTNVWSIGVLPNVSITCCLPFFGSYVRGIRIFLRWEKNNAILVMDHLPVKLLGSLDCTTVSSSCYSGGEMFDLRQYPWGILKDQLDRCCILANRLSVLSFTIGPNLACSSLVDLARLSPSTEITLPFTLHVTTVGEF